MTESESRAESERDAESKPSDESESSDDVDRHSRRVLWAMPTGLYLIGSRWEETVNLMTANLVVQVCLQPKLVAAAIEADSVTADLVTRSGSFSLSLLRRADKAVVRRFVKPVREVERDDDGRVTAMSGQSVREAGPDRLPVLAAAVGHLLATITERRPLGSHVLFIGQVSEVGGEPTEVLRMEDTLMHYGG